MTDTIPTLAHAVRIGSDLSLYRERERAELIISHAHGGVLVELVDRKEYERERQSRIAAEMALHAPVLEIRACGCDRAKSGRCVMGDYGALPIGTQLYAGAAPERAEPQPRLICSSNGLLGATSGVGRECGMWIEGVCTSPEPCQHQQQARPCRCGPDSVACLKGGAA